MSEADAKKVDETKKKAEGGEDDDDLDEGTKKRLADLTGKLESSSTETVAGGVLKTELENEIDASTKNLMMRVRRSIAIVKKESPNIRLQTEANAGEMKTVDVDSLLGIIKDTQLKMEVQKAVKSSEKMVRDISNLLSSEGFL